MAYQLVIMGYDSNNRLPVSLLSTGGNGPSAIHTMCRPCIKTGLVFVSPAVAPPTTYVAGPNDVATDTKELYVFEFPDRISGWNWMTVNKDVLFGKWIHSIDDALDPSA